MMREYYPEDYQKLKGYVAAGRWFPCGSSVDEGRTPTCPNWSRSCGTCCTGTATFRKEFGKDSSEFMLPDCFGFPASAAVHPRALRHQGFLHAEADLGLGGRHPLQGRDLDRAGRQVR